MPILSVLTEGRVPVKVWSPLDSIEAEAVKQLTNTARLPFVFKHIAVMPDVHTGIGATIGSVIATKGAICPAAVGVDIGCGMMAVKTDLSPGIVQDNIAKIRHSIERAIPVGFQQNKTIEKSVENWEKWSELLYSELMQKAMLQMGSLGGGNHFIEICIDTNQFVWVMLHSGSRGVGNTIARRHIDYAKGIMAKYLIELPDPDLAYFAENTPEFDNYFKDLMWCQEYALQNRIEMMNRCLKELSLTINNKNQILKIMEINCHHNYVEREHHYEQNVLITRKGAVRARRSDYGIIPGSMGTKSFIIQGLENDESFHSCSHGAGRRMSRTKARANFSRDDLMDQTNGVECRKDEGVIDEIPGAYKDIEEVMQNQNDLVKIVAELKQIMCIKG